MNDRMGRARDGRLAFLAALVAAASAWVLAPAGVGASEGGGEAEAGATVEMSSGGLSVTSADGVYGLRLRGWAQLANRTFLGDEASSGPDESLLRRVRTDLSLSAHHFRFRIHSELVGGLTLVDAYLDATPSRALSVRVGLMKTPFGFELLQSPNAIPFLERGLPSGLVPNRDVGAMVFGELAEGLFEYQVGTFNGVRDGGSSAGRGIGGDPDVVARAFVWPFAQSGIAALAGLGLGGALTWGELVGSPANPELPRYVTAGRLPVFQYASDGTDGGTAVADGTRARVTGQAYYHLGGFELMGEYVATWQGVRLGDQPREELHHAAFGVQAAYAIGGTTSPGGVRPHHEIDLDGGMGALEIKARVGQLRLDSDAFAGLSRGGSMERVTEVAGGLNHWLASRIRLMADYVFTTFEAPAGGQDRPDEHLLMVTVQFGLH